MQLHGVHHVTAITANARENLRFYTEVLGLRLVKKTVNQDDVSAYHLFYADKKGTPGTDMTFFDWPQAGPNQEQNDGIIRTSFRVNGPAALQYWVDRFDSMGVIHSGIERIGERDCLRFVDPEGQSLVLVDDAGASFDGEVWDQFEVPPQFGLRGFFATHLAIPTLSFIDDLLLHILEFQKTGEYPSLDRPGERVIIYAMDGGGPGKEVHVVERPGLGGRLGAGGVHHVAFRLKDAQEQQAWIERFNEVGLNHSGQIDRFYFKSLYFRISQGILFELATDGPGFAADEPPEHLGEALSLPPFLEPRRREIESRLKPL